MSQYYFRCPSCFIMLLGITLLTPFSSIAQDDEKDDYAVENHLRYDDYIYDDSIKTVLLYNTSSELSYPVINLKGMEQLKLSFDDLRRADLSNFYFTVIHCNANWEPSELNKNEYIDGFFEDEIFDYKYSTNTDITYVHYEIKFPNENMKLTKSGNYILMVYKENDDTNPIITRRFLVYDPKLSVKLTAKRATDVNDSYFKHEVDFEINHEGYDIPYPFEKLQVVLMQNFRFDNAITGLKPIYIKDSKLVYDYNNGENVFNAINEFREFDTKSIKYQSIRINYFEYNVHDKTNHAYLLNDESRSYKQYYSRQDINGNFLIKKDGAVDTDIDADYINVHFSLPYDPPLRGGSLYLLGKFSDWKFKEDFKLAYDTVNRKYHQQILLKQGFYNYVYCFVKDGSKNTGDVSIIEGAHFETENAYSILVYHREFSDNFDQLVGLKTMTNKE